MNPDGSGLAKLTDNRIDDVSPAWSPDGRYLTFTATLDGDDDIYLMRADGSGPVRLTEDPALDFGSSWGPLATQHEEAPGEMAGDSPGTR